MSLLILIQALGLAYLACYIYKVPTWTDMLDALAVARIANSLEKADIPALGSLNSGDLARLRHVDALVGVVKTHEQDSSRLSEIGSTTAGEVELGLGAAGLFTRRLARFRVKRLAGEGEMDCFCEGCQRRRAGGLS